MIFRVWIFLVLFLVSMASSSAQLKSIALKKQGNQTSLYLTINGPFTHKLFLLNQPKRVVLDLKETQLAVNLNTKVVSIFARYHPMKNHKGFLKIAKIVEDKGLRQVTDTGAIEKAIDDVLAANASKVAEYKGGQEKLFGFFVGQVMKAMAGKGNPAIIGRVGLRKNLNPDE